eukprot:TRINITY_DN11471_c0_g1_i1.p1 TRINITY_DN11471_c0_g1~~TRINITY_DN11471_c0_g1_i1.p1  ORF type:complete len:212 (+),score=35.24 TRINITY_DN11471_c0_g1_i1:422-1057(+)
MTRTIPTWLVVAPTTRRRMPSSRRQSTSSSRSRINSTSNTTPRTQLLNVLKDEGLQGPLDSAGEAIAASHCVEETGPAAEAVVHAAGLADPHKELTQQHERLSKARAAEQSDGNDSAGEALGVSHCVEMARVLARWQIPQHHNDRTQPIDSCLKETQAGAEATTDDIAVLERPAAERPVANDVLARAKAIIAFEKLRASRAGATDGCAAPT